MLSSPSLDLMPQQCMLPTAALVAYAALLALPGAELEQAVAAELDDNPALVMDAAKTCTSCGMPGGMRCGDCGWQTRRAGNTETCLSPGGTSAGDLASRTSWPEIVLRDLRLLLPACDAGIAAAVVASLDDRGYLTENASVLAGVGRSDVASVERVIRTLRETGPAGIAARDLRDCLLLQMDRLAADGVTNPVARTVIADHLAALARGAGASIARQAGVRAEDIAQARDFIRRELLPRPALPGGSSAAEPIVPVRPDVVISADAGAPDGFAVEVVEEWRLSLRVDPSFRRVARHDPAVSALVRRGDLFVSRLRQRWATMRRVTEYLVGQRPDLVRGGQLRDGRLTRADVAAGLGLNPSTVSRATAGRYALLPSARLLPYAAFFDGSLGIRLELQNLIAAESRPLADTELCELLQRAGHQVARRTVAKYRSQLQMLPSAHR
ncbi:MAG TPA: hypothetical protein VGM53_23505 [Streptosporangiaceae bacterium]|jgi:RNA polymerase sigma-54 factor